MKRVAILWAAGCDFHNFNVVFRGNHDYEVVAFTATQIPDIADRRYPAELAGDRYPAGIPIVEECELEKLIAEQEVDIVVFSYSDVSHQTLMHLASCTVAAGADFWLLGAEHTQVKSIGSRHIRLCPAKPIGPFYSRSDAEDRQRRLGWQIVEDAARGYRRVVPSPEPIEIVEFGVIRRLIDGVLVVACGGGGIPVVSVNDERSGVEAVIC